jgi:tetratricopeptide (TPR) repeat protein
MTSGKREKGKGKNVEVFFKKELFTVFCLLPFALCPVVAVASTESYLHYVRALAAERSGSVQEALGEYRKVVELDPNALEAYRDIAELELHAGHADEALAAAEKARDLAPKDATSYVFIGHVHLLKSDTARAAADFEEALKYDPDNLIALKTLGALYSNSDPAKALDYYNRCLAVDADAPEVYFRMGWLYQKQGNTAQAEENYKKSIELDADEASSHLALAGLYEAENKMPEAIVEYEAGAKLDNGNGLIFVRLGHIYYERKNFSAAESVFLRARDINPKDPNNYYWLARIVEEKKKWKDAGDYVDKAYHLSHNPQFLPLLAYYLTLQGRMRQAIKWLEIARKTESDNSNVLLFLGMNYIEEHRYEKARQVLEAGVKKFPEDPQMHFQLGLACDDLRQFELAMDEFRTVLRLDPKNPAAMNYLGYSYADKGMRLDEAEKLIRTAVELEPQNGAFIDSLGWVRFKQGYPEEAQKYLEQAVSLMPDALIYDHLGDVYMARRLPDRAIEAWNRARKMDSSFPGLRQKIKTARTTAHP